MAVKKITYDGTVLIDLTGDTASAADVRTGKTFHANDGTIQTGTFNGGGTDYTEAFISRTYPLTASTSFGNTTVGSGAFAWYNAPDKYLCFNNCTTVSAHAFHYAAFSGLSFPAITTIGDNAFDYVTVNSFLEFENCTIIGSNAFEGATINGTAAFPACVTIHSSAFAYAQGTGTLSFPVCTNITSTALPFYSTKVSVCFPTMTTVPSGAFQYYSCSQLVKSMFPSATIVQSSAFRSAKGITRIDWDGLLSAYQWAFGYCTALVSINLPSLKGTAGANLFYGDTVLSDVSLPNLNACAAGTFYSCHGLTSIYLPNVSYISNTTFAYCSYLTAAYFPTLNKISSTYAFRNCLRLISLYLLSTAMVTLTSRVTFTSTPLYGYSTVAGQWGSIYVRQSLLSTYLANTNWASFADRLVGLTDAQISALPIYS